MPGAAFCSLALSEEVGGSSSWVIPNTILVLAASTARVLAVLVAVSVAPTVAVAVVVAVAIGLAPATASAAPPSFRRSADCCVLQKKIKTKHSISA